MRNRLFAAANTAFSEVLIFFFVCCLATMAAATKIANEFSQLDLGAAIVGGTILFCWLVWMTYVLVSKKEVVEMEPKRRVTLETCSRLLGVVWIFLTFSPVWCALPFALLIIWDGYRSIRQLAMSN